MFRVDAFYKSNKAHWIDLSWFDLCRPSFKQIERDIEWNPGRARSEFFLNEHDDWDGDLMDLYLRVDYEFSERIAAGVRFNTVTFDNGNNVTYALYLLSIQANLKDGQMNKYSSSMTAPTCWSASGAPGPSRP